ncbi:pantetheine-phosphate adenylyltransferase [Treponema primitia]|uniref:pantetheine-phosphate adenylyltransferase n=1 Tax=Treponema primitia TaxID=88058 RepID=UPI00397FBA5C
MLKAAFPGSFDPPTFGHLDIIERAAALFDELTVVFTENRQKKSLFPLEERLSMVSELVKPWKNITVESSGALTVDFMKARGIKVLIRGIRGPVDFPYEFDLSLWNKTLYPNMETLFMTSAPRYAQVSSSAIKELASFHKDLSGYVPSLVEAALKKVF